MSVFKKAERNQAKLNIAITGPSGSGKTFSSLRLAKGLGKKVAVIDTENKSASLYADRFDFDTLTLEAPYTIQKYIDAIKAAVEAGYDVLVVDSITHAWAGEGGLLAKKESLDARGGNSYTNWASITKEQELFKATILNSQIHMICTMRSKQEYVIEQNERGKSAPKKVGMAPIQRDGMEYEFTTVFDVAADHQAAISKDRTGLFEGAIEKITELTGEKFLAWLSLGAKMTAPVIQAPAAVSISGTTKAPPASIMAPSHEQPQRASMAQLGTIFDVKSGLLLKYGWSREEFKAYHVETFGVQSPRDLSVDQFEQAIYDLQTMPPRPGKVEVAPTPAVAQSVKNSSPGLVVSQETLSADKSIDSKPAVEMLSPGDLARRAAQRQIAEKKQIVIPRRQEQEPANDFGNFLA